ncbi:MAG TPA: hypothetical protein VF306_22390 [Pirellulales bacterium]
MRAGLSIALAWRCAAICLTLASRALASAESAPQDKPAFDINVLEREMSAAVRTDPRLRGAWLDIEHRPDPTGDTPGSFMVRRVLDATHAAAQRELLGRFLHSWLPAGNFHLAADDDRLFPFSRLMAELELAVETDPALGGCQVTAGYYTADPNQPGSLNLVLRGRIAKEGQEIEIESLCGRLMRRNPVWVRGEPASGEQSNDSGFIPLTITPKSTELAVVEPSDAQGRWFYAAGLRHFWKQQYTQAAQSFHQASLESPRSLTYHYWWILTDLASGRKELALRRMRTVARRFREADFDHQSPEYRLIARSLERVQGPLRQELQQLETRALYGGNQLGANY